jgi:hypothetical protein
MIDSLIGWSVGCNLLLKKIERERKKERNFWLYRLYDIPSVCMYGMIQYGMVRYSY